MYPHIHLLGLTIPTFGVLMSTGILLCILMMRLLLRWSPFSEDDLITCALWSIICGMLGSKCLYWITQWRVLLADPKEFFHMITSGLVLYGSMIGGIIGVLIFCKRRKFHFFQAADIMCVGFANGQAFGRIGCHMAGCCYGKETASFLHVTFPDGVGCIAPAGVPLVPTQLMEAIFCGLLSVYLFFLYKKQKPTGTVLYSYCLLYGVFRFVIEFWRGDADRGFIGPLSTSQFIGIGVVLFGLLVLLLIRSGKVRIVPRETSDPGAGAHAPEQA